MIKIIHRVNSLNQLKNIKENFGVEVDIRSNNKNLILAHDIGGEKEDFLEFIKSYNHKIFVANVKESGIENLVIDELEKNNIKDFFLLDVEFPYILQNYKKHGEKLCLRFSKFEGIDTINNFKGKIKWVWIDTYDDFDLDIYEADILRNFKLCLVSPTRWGHEDKINYYIEKFQKFDLLFEAIMVEDIEEI